MTFHGTSPWSSMVSVDTPLLRTGSGYVNQFVRGRRPRRRLRIPPPAFQALRLRYPSTRRRIPAAIPRRSWLPRRFPQPRPSGAGPALRTPFDTAPAVVVQRRENTPGVLALPLWKRRSSLGAKDPDPVATRRAAPRPEYASLRSELHKEPPPTSRAGKGGCVCSALAIRCRITLLRRRRRPQPPSE